MRFMVLFKSAADSDAPPREQEVAGMGQLIGEMAQAGVLLAADGLPSSVHGARVRISHGGFTVTDGPFTETKELVAGFAILQTSSKEEAIEWAKRFLQVVREGESEVRLMHDEPAFKADESHAARVAANR